MSNLTSTIYLDPRQAPRRWRWPARWMHRLWWWAIDLDGNYGFLFRPLCWWNRGHEIDGERYSPLGYCVICQKEFTDLIHDIRHE